MLLAGPVDGKYMASLCVLLADEIRVRRSSCVLSSPGKTAVIEIATHIAAYTVRRPEEHDVGETNE